MTAVLIGLSVLVLMLAALGLLLLAFWMAVARAPIAYASDVRCEDVPLRVALESVPLAWRACECCELCLDAAARCSDCPYAPREEVA